MFNLLHLLLVVATQITRSWCLHDTVELNLLYKKPTLNHSTSKINK